MANNCYFEMKIAGEKEKVEEFLQMLRKEGPFKKTGLGRIFSFEENEVLRDFDPEQPSLIAVQGYGDCAWSLNTALIDLPDSPLKRETKRLNLVVEAYSSEPGEQFQEHLLVNKGEIKFHETVDYEEHFVEGLSEAEKQEFVVEHDVSIETLKENINYNGDYCIGGFDEWEFDDLFSFFENQKTHDTPSLESQIKAAEGKREEASQNKNQMPELQQGK